MISDTYALAIKVLLKDNGDGDAHKDFFLQILIGFLHWACGMPERLATCCDNKWSTQWNNVNDHNPSGLHQHLTWRTTGNCGEKFQKHLKDLVSFVSFLNMTHLLRNLSPQKVNVVCLPMQSTAFENFTIKIVGYWTFSQFIKL